MEAQRRYFLNELARVRNTMAIRSEAALSVLLTADGVASPGFPATRSDLNTLSVATTTALLEAYGLDTKGRIDAKRWRLGRFCGLTGM